MNAGFHSARKYKDNGLELSVMWVEKPFYKDKYNQNVNEMINSRMVFTEIDHNFVNPVSDDFSGRIDAAFKNKEQWANDEVPGASAYTDPYMIFNEYMTWALFSLYSYDNFPEEDADIYISMMEKQMSERRGFIDFKDFNQELIRMYKEQPAIDVESLYQQILLWSENQ